MRILIITTHIDSLGGIEEYCRTLARTLLTLGHEVEVWSLFDEPSKKGSVINTRYLAPSNRWGMSAYFRLRTPYLMQLLLRKASSFDLVLAMHVIAVPALYRASLARRNLRYWVWVHGSEVWGGISQDIAKGMSRAVKIVAVSEYTARKLQQAEHGVYISEIIYPPIDTEWFIPAADMRRKEDLLTLLSVGRTDDYGICYKGHDMVINSLKKIEERIGGRVEYRIVGSGERIDNLKALAAKRGVHESVLFLGNIEKKDLREEYQNCDLFILPSRMEVLPNGYITGEGFGIVYAEAAACGKPVVGSKHGGAAEAVLDGVTGYLVDPTSTEEIVNAVCEILENPEKATQMGNDGRVFVENNFSVKVFEKRIAALLESV